MPLIPTEDDPPVRMGGMGMDILKVAREAGIGWTGIDGIWQANIGDLQRFADSILSEAADKCRSLRLTDGDDCFRDGCDACEQAIRAMKGAA